ncbi:hypothetical protein DMC47_35705 [Nostoc sp. 3335mG]|nr:hypothetical protein DMC47_35705 [Nostoc sp. 3335mG]
MATALTAPSGVEDSTRRPRLAIDLKLAAIVILMVAIAARWRTFGDPVIHIDEQFYLLVGGRMLHGALPYIDIWDRKPIGLFLIYAFFHMFGSGVLAYQIGALVSVWLTALLLFVMGRRIASPGGALVGAVLYVLYLNLAGGEGGQAPVFYNLPVAAAIALIFFHRRRAETNGGDLRWIGAASMLLFGIALQIKYSAVFEGMFAGVMLLWLAWANGRSLGRLAIEAVLWVGCALAPTILSAAAYAGMGHIGEWWFANATSILMRKPEQPAMVAVRIKVMLMLMVPLVLGVPLRRWTGSRPADPGTRADLRFLDGWAAAALMGVVLFGSWFNHYALPLFAPFALIAAPLWNRRGGRIWLTILLAVVAAKGQHILYRHSITRGTGETLAAAVEATRGAKGCYFVYDGMPAFYDATNSCLLTDHPFSAHLQSLNEMGATGIDEAQEVRRVMTHRPERIMTMEPAYDGENLAARREIYRVLARDYRLLYYYDGGGHDFTVYGLKGTVPNGPPRIEKADTHFF